MTAPTINSLTKKLSNEMEAAGVWKDGSPVPLNRLSLVTISYFDFAGIEHHDGEMITLDVVADKVAEIFLELHKIRFPINKIKSIHHYKADDEASMADNNSSCFCYRPAARTGAISIHSYGVAVDINPLQNPYIVINEEQGTANIHPKSGWEFLNRHKKRPGMVEDIVSIFSKHGFLIWGGQWSSPIDYHHFQLHRGTTELLLAMTLDDGKLFIDSTIEHKNKLPLLASMPHGKALEPLLALYRKNKADFFKSWTKFLISERQQ